LSSCGAGINNVGQVVGQVVGHSQTATDRRHAILYANGVTTDLGTLRGGTYSWTTGINLSGQIVGRSDGKVGPDVLAHATRWFGANGHRHRPSGRALRYGIRHH
jgi:probable HAF family extracellular repeat protein